MFWGLLRKKSLEEIFNEIWPLARNQSSSEFKRILNGNKIFNKNWCDPKKLDGLSYLF